MTAPIGGWRVEVLGPLRVLGPGRAEPVRVSAAQERVLRLLAASAPAAVSVDHLVAVVWSGDPPLTARASLHNQVSRIRRLTVPGLVVTEGDAYRLAVDTDRASVIALLDAAEAALIAGRHADALTAADAALGSWRGDGHEVEVRRGAEWVAIRAALGCGLFARVIRDGERLLAVSPHDEGLWAVVATALHRAGRRGDALGAIGRARAALASGLGLGVGGDLAEVEREILEADGVVAAAHGRFVGRADELATVRTVVDRRGCAVVRGQDGIGRSAFAHEVRRVARRMGVRVALATGDPVPTAGGSVLSALLDEFSLTADVRLGLVDGFVAAMTTAGRERPMLVVVDDAHLLGPSSRAALASVATGGAVAVVLTVWDLAEVPVPEGAEVVDLGPLSDGEIAEMLGPDADPEVVRAAAGNPLVARVLQSGRGGDGLAGFAEVGEVVRRRLVGLGPWADAVASTVAVLGRQATPEVLGRVVPAEWVRRAEVSGLIVRGADGVASFRSDAFRRAVYDAVPVGERAELHLVAAEAAERSGGSAAEVAHHRVAAADLDPGRAAAAAMAAGAEASANGLHAEAARWFRRAIVVAERSGDADRVRWARVGLGDALRLAGDPEHAEVLLAAARDAVASRDLALVTAATRALAQLGAMAEPGPAQVEAVGLVEAALTLLEGDERWASVAAAATVTAALSGDPLAEVDRFVEAERRAVSPAVRAEVLPAAYLSLGHPEHLVARRRVATELSALADASGDAALVSEACQLWLSIGCLEGDGALVRRSLAEMEAAVVQANDVGRRWQVVYAASGVAHLEDRLDEAERLATVARDLFAPVSMSRALAAYVSQMWVVEMARGRVDVMRAGLEPFTGAPELIPRFALVYPYALGDTDPVGSRRWLIAGLAGSFRDFTAVAGLMFGGRAAAAIGDRELGARFREMLAPWSGLGVWQGTCSYGPVDATSMVLARLAGDVAAAERHRAVAEAWIERMDAPVFARELEALVAGTMW